MLMNVIWLAGGANQRGAHQGLSVHPADEHPSPIPEASQRPALLPKGLPPGATSVKSTRCFLLPAAYFAFWANLYHRCG